MTLTSKLPRSVMRHSVADTIRVLENNPVRPDMVAELTIAQVMNRVSTAHLSIERALKFLITKAEGPLVKDHDLPSRLKELREHEPAAAQFLEEAFTDAVQHYRYKTNARHMKHLQSLETYLEATGSDKDFQDIRYWELTQSTDDVIVREIYLSIHLELLHAAEELLMPPGRTKQTVALRVEKAVQEALHPRNLANVPGTDREQSIRLYLGWLNGFLSRKEAITKALREGEAPDDEFTLEMLNKAYQELANSTDPAVKYFAETIIVLPSQPRDAKPCVEWLGPEKYQTGNVSTPAGDHLGFIFRRTDGLWNIEPGRDGSIMVTNIAKSQTDARCFLALLLTKPARVLVNGDERNLRIVGEEYDLFNRNYSQVPSWPEKTELGQWPTHEVHFWSGEHGITKRDNLRLEVRSKRFENIIDVLEGTVTGVSGHKISIDGMDSTVSVEPETNETDS